MMLAMSAMGGSLIEAHSQSSLFHRLLPWSGATLRHVCSSSISRLRVCVDILLDTALGPILAVVVVLELVSRVAIEKLWFLLRLQVECGKKAR